MPQPSIPYACARVSALSKGLLDQQTIKRMADGSLDDAMRTLLDVRYGNLPDATSADCERMIDNTRTQTAAEIRELSPKPAITDLFLLATDIQNLKMLLKARLLGMADAQTETGGLYSREALLHAVAEQDYRDFPDPIRESLERLEQKLKVEVEPQQVSIMLDRGYLQHALAVAAREKDEFAATYFRALCDFDNLITFLRMRATGAPREDLKDVLLPVGGIRREDLMNAYELSEEALNHVIHDSTARDAIATGLAEMQQTGNIGALERQRDDYLLSLVKAHKHEVLTIYPLLGYLFAREREAKAIRLILTVKRNGLDDAVIQERLCELYG